MNLGDLIRSWMSKRDEPPAPTTASPPPPDGEVGFAAMAGVQSRPNPCDPRFACFLARDELRAADPQVGRGRRRDGPRELKGRLVLVSLFVGRDGQSWSEREIALAHRALVRAGRWLESEAARWKAPLQVELAQVYFAADDFAEEDVEITFRPEGDHEAPFEREAVVKAIASGSRAVTALGFPDLIEMIRDVQPRIDADHHVWIVHLRRAGRSLAVAEDDTPIPGITLALCYAREAALPEALNGPPFTDPVTLAHELLHLFGATDKYEVPLSAYPRSLVTDRDVMVLAQSALSRLRIDPLTAREIGWVKG